MKKLFVVMICALLAVAPALAWKHKAPASSTDLRGKGVILADSFRVKAVTADTQKVTGCQYQVYARDAGTANFMGAAFFNGQISAFSGIDGVSGYGTIQNFSKATVSAFKADSFAIGGGAEITSIDTSAAGDSSKMIYLNGNKIMHFGTEVKAP